MCAAYTMHMSSPTIRLHIAVLDDLTFYNLHGMSPLHKLPANFAPHRQLLNKICRTKYANSNSIPSHIWQTHISIMNVLNLTLAAHKSSTTTIRTTSYHIFQNYCMHLEHLSIFMYAVLWPVPFIYIELDCCLLSNTKSLH